MAPAVAAEINQFDGAAVLYKDVTRLQAAVHDAAIVSRPQAVADLMHHCEALFERGERRLRQRRAVEQLHHREGTAVVVAKIEDGHNVRVRHLSGQPGLLMHARISRFPHPHGNAPADRFVDARVHRAQRAVADAVDDCITPDSRRMTTVVQRVGKFVGNVSAEEKV